MDDRPAWSRVPRARCRVAGGQRHVEFGHAERLGRILQAPFGFRLRVGEALDQRYLAVDELEHFVDAHVEHDAAPDRRGRVVDVDDDAACATHRGDRALDQVGARLGQHHRRDVVRDQIVFDQVADHVEVDLRRGRKAEFDFLEADAHEFVEQAQLLRLVHRVEQGLVAVAQVGRQPDRRRADAARRPLPVGQVDDGIRAVLGLRIGDHDGAMERSGRASLPKRASLPSDLAGLVDGRDQGEVSLRVRAADPGRG